MNHAQATQETAEDLMQWMKERLSSVKVPKSIDFMEQLPRMDNGKLYKRHLMDAYQ
jgi:fatty-acyl-CoA synthase